MANKCCQKRLDGKLIEPSGPCSWKWGGYGQQLTCDMGYYKNNVVVGRCGSGEIMNTSIYWRVMTFGLVWFGIVGPGF